MHRMSLALLILIPLLVVAGVIAFGRALPLPYLGRDYVVGFDLAEGGADMLLPDILGPDDPTRPLVVIDPGHGGHDPGAAGEEYREKTVVLGLARSLRDELLANGGIRVAMTRDDDRFLALGERVAIARNLGADLFLSIHADSAGEKDEISGASIYSLSDEASSEAAARFAERENNADVVNGTVLSGQSANVNAILVELSQRRSSGESREFADLVVREGQDELLFHPQTLRSASLAVLRAPDVPSVLFEAGFMSNTEDAQRLVSLDGQRAFARSLARAIRIFLARKNAQAAGNGAQ